MAIANDVYLAHLWNYDQEEPKNRSQKFLFQFNELGNKLHKQFDIVAERLRTAPNDISILRKSNGCNPTR